MTVYTSLIMTTTSETSTERQTRHFSSISGTRGVDVWWPGAVYAGDVCICVLCCGVLTYRSNGCVICPCVCVSVCLSMWCPGFGWKVTGNIPRNQERKCDEIYWNFTFIVLNIWFSYNCSDIFVKLIWKLINEFKEIIWKSKYMWINLSV